MRTATATSDLLAALDALSRAQPDERLRLFREIPDAFPVFQQLDPAYQHEILSRLERDEAARLVEALDPDDRVRLLDAMPEDGAEAIRRELSPREQALTDRLLAFPEESAGRIMTPEFLSLRRSMSAQDALAAIRRRGRETETIYALPVVDDEGRLAGLVALDELVFAAPEAPVGDVMETEVPSVRADEDQEVVARLMLEADALAVPVVDAEDRLLGLVTIDDAVDVLESEEAEDLARAGAAEPLGRPYFSVSMTRLVRSRIVWLLVLSLAGGVSVRVLGAFEAVLDRIVSLSLFIPLLIGVGGNVGAQSSTTIVRAMAVDQVRAGDLVRVVLREGRAGLLLGAALALAAFLPVAILFETRLAAVISISMVSIATLAALVGAILPMLADRLGIDPAVFSTPLVTTIVDASGLLIYLFIARAVLTP